MSGERAAEALGEHGGALLSPLSVQHLDASEREVDVLDAQAKGLHEPEAAAVEKAGRQGEDAVDLSEKPFDLLPGEDHGHDLRSPRPGEVSEITELQPDDVPEEEMEGVQGPPLGGGGELPLDDQIFQEGLHSLGGEDLSRIPPVKGKVPPDPVLVGLHRAVRILPYQGGLPEPTEDVPGVLLSPEGAGPS